MELAKPTFFILLGRAVRTRSPTPWCGLSNQGKMQEEASGSPGSPSSALEQPQQSSLRAAAEQLLSSSRAAAAVAQRAGLEIKEKPVQIYGNLCKSVESNTNPTEIDVNLTQSQEAN